MVTFPILTIGQALSALWLWKAYLSYYHLFLKVLAKQTHLLNHRVTQAIYSKYAFTIIIKHPLCFFTLFVIIFHWTTFLHLLTTVQRLWSLGYIWYHTVGQRWAVHFPKGPYEKPGLLLRATLLSLWGDKVNIDKNILCYLLIWSWSWSSTTVLISYAASPCGR